MSNNRITPFVKRMRANGGTIYTFSSAVEDIGLNINERNNLVKISHFALLNIPSIAESDGSVNTFNVRNIPGAWEYERNSTSVKDGRVLIAESFQNYALNLEANLLNQSTYNPALTATVSERVFWKWLKETGAVRWADPSTSTQYTGYRWTEELGTDASSYDEIVKYVGQVSAGNVRTDTFGTYNETYILVPTSHGQTRAYFKQIEDDNYYHGMEIGNLGENILGREGYTKPHPDGLSMKAYYDFVDSSTQLTGGNEYDLEYDFSTGIFEAGQWFTAEGREPASTDNAYLTDSSSYLDASVYYTNIRYTLSSGTGPLEIEFKRSNVDCLSLETNINVLREIYADSALTWNSMATGDYAVDDSFNFNAALIYYTVYNSTKDEVLATNLLGIMFLDAPSGNSSQITDTGVGILLPSLEKIMSGPAGFGTSYSLRLNIKTDNMLDDTTAVIVDQATSDQLWAEEWTDVFQNLDTAVNILTQQNSTINYISGQYVVLQGNQTQIINTVKALQFQVNDIGQDIQGVAGTVPLFSDGDDPLIESSIYMKYGRIGVFETDPQWGVHIDSSVKMKDLVIENAVRDTSNNIILGYGSPLQLGASTNYRQVNIYTGNNTAAIQIDTSNHISINGDLSINASYVQFDSSVISFGDASITSSSFKFDATYIPDASIPGVAGTGLTWINGELNAGESSTYGAGQTGDVQFVDASSSLVADSNFNYDVVNTRLALGKPSASYTLDVSGTVNIDGPLDVSGTVNIDGPLDVSGTVNIDGPLNSGNVIIDGSLNIDGSLYLWNTLFTGGGGGGGTGDVAWASGSVGSQYQIIIANGDGSIVAESLQIISGDTIRAPYPSGLYLESGGGAATTGDVGITTGGAGGGGGSGDIYIKTGAASTIGGNITIGVGTGPQPGGDVSIYAGTASGASPGGDIYISGGGQSGPPGAGGDVYISGGDGVTTGGRVFIGELSSHTREIFVGNATTLPLGTPAVSEILFADTGLSYQLKRVSGAIKVAAGGTGMTSAGSNYVITGTGGTTLAAEANLRFDGTQLRIYNGANENVRFTADGSIHARGDIVAFSTIFSDERLKDNIEPLENSLDKVLQLEGISYNRKLNGDKHLGFIAQKVEKIIPEVVVEMPLPLETGGDEVTPYKTIRYQEIIPYLTEAIKDQQKQIDHLKKEIEILKNK